MLNFMRLILAMALVPAGALAQGDGLEKARSMVDSMREIVGEVETFADETREDAIKQTCVAGAHREMSDVIATVEEALQEAAGQGAEAQVEAVQAIEAGLTTVQQLRSEMYDCVGPEDLGPGGAAARAYDPVRSSREKETVGVPALRPPAASATK